MDSQSKSDSRKAARTATLTKALQNMTQTPIIPEQTIDFDVLKRNVIACGPSHALALGTSDVLYGWGANQFQQLGQSEHRKTLEVPTPIELGVKGGDVYVPVQVACGLKHSIVLTRPFQGNEAGTKVFITGSRQNGRLGRKSSLEDLDDEEDRVEEDDDDDDELSDMEGNAKGPAIVQTVASLDYKCILMVACGGSFSLALTNTGHVYSWGDGSSGALGLDTYDDVPEPRMIFLDSKKEKFPSMKFIAAGYGHSIGISSDGRMFGWGGGDMGQLGTLEPRNTSMPTLAWMPRIKINMASCGMYNTMVVSDDQLLFGCGANKNGQLGFPDLTNREHLEEVVTLSSEPVKWVACGGNHTLVLTMSNKVYAFGNNNHFKCGVFDAQEVGSNITVPSLVDLGEQVYQIAASLNLSMAITKGGEIYTWGKGTGGLLGRAIVKAEGGEPVEESPSPGMRPLADDFEFYIPASIGAVFLKREGDAGDADKLSVSIKSIQCGLFHTVALTNAGELYVWGSNEYGQHGQSTSEIQRVHDAKSSKLNDKNHLELPPECLPSLVPQFDIKLNKRVTSIGTGSHHIIAVENFRKVYTWGRNIEGQLGLGMSCKEIPEPTQINELTGNIIKEVAASEAHSLILFESGEIYAFGSPLYGRLGIGLTSTLQLSPRKIYDLPKATKIRCGPTHSMALVVEKTDETYGVEEKEDYALYTWGSGWGGKLGQGHVDNCFVPTRVDTSIRFSEISCGENHSAGITKKGKLYIWGPRENFGLVEKRASDILGEYKSKLSDFYILKPSLYNHHLFENEKFSYVALGNHYNLALSETNVLYKWGNFDKSYEEDFQKTGGNHAHTTDKDLADLEKVEKHCDFLKNTFESLPEMQDFIVSVDCTSNHAVAFSQRYAYSWGIDSYTGRLGHTKDQGEGEEGGEAKDDAYDKKLDNPKVIKFLANILNRNTQKLNTQRQAEAQEGDATSGKTKKSSRSKRSEGSKRMGGRSRSTVKNSKLNASSMTSFIDANEDDEAGGGSTIKNFIDDLKISVTDHRYQKVMNLTDDLEATMKKVYQKYAELKGQVNNISHFSHSAETIVVKRLLSKPFSITPSHKHFYKFPKEFADNRTVYARLYTILQLHPCYIRNMYLTKKIPILKLYQIIKEIFGDMEGDKRKTKLFMALCIEILREELKHKNPYSLNFDSFDETKPDTTPLFTRLFKLFMKSSAQNMTYLALVEGRLRAAVEAAVSSVTNKAMKPYALVFRREDVTDILEKYKNESDAFRHTEMEKIVKRAKEAVDKVFDDINKKVIQGSGKENAGDPKSKSISGSVKYLLKKCVDITIETFRNTELVPDQIESKALALIFAPLREKLKKNVKKESNGNILSLINALIMYIKGVSFSSESQKWVTELNNSIRKGDERRRKLFSWFHSKDYNFEEKLVKSTFVHSTEMENDKIQCTLGNLAFLTKFLKENAGSIAVIHPQNLDYVAKFTEKLNPQSNYLLKDPSADEAKKIVNLKLKTRQLLYGDSSAMKICNDCDAFLKESLVSTNNRVLVEKMSKEDPRSLDTYYKNFLIDLGEGKTEQFLEGNEDFDLFTKRIIDNYKAMADWEKVGGITTFLRGLEEELLAKHPFIATYDNQKMNQVRYELVKELQSKLMNRLRLENITLDEIDDHAVLFNNILSVVRGSCRTRSEEINNLKYVLDALKYGSSVQNTDADKILSKNRQSMYSALKGQLSRTPQSKDLVENLNETEKGSLKLFGKYSVRILRIKKILVEFYDPEFPNLNKKCKDVDKYSVIFTKNNKDIRISLIYTAKNATLLSLLLGVGKSSNNDFEEIVDETILSEHDILGITQSATKNKENPKIIKIGKFIEVNSSKFLELLNTLHSNQEIYDQQVMRTNHPKDVKKAEM